LGRIARETNMNSSWLPSGRVRHSGLSRGTISGPRTIKLISAFEKEGIQFTAVHIDKSFATEKQTNTQARDWDVGRVSQRNRRFKKFNTSLGTASPTSNWQKIFGAKGILINDGG